MKNNQKIDQITNLQGINYDGVICYDHLVDVKDDGRGPSKNQFIIMMEAVNKDSKLLKINKISHTKSDGSDSVGFPYIELE